MVPVELGLASNPPGFLVQERLVYEPGDGTYEDPEEDEHEENDPDEYVMREGGRNECCKDY